MSPDMRDSLASILMGALNRTVRPEVNREALLDMTYAEVDAILEHRDESDTDEDLLQSVLNAGTRILRDLQTEWEQQA